MKAIYAVRDKLAGIIIGNVLTFAHDAPAARFFRDAINDEGSPCSKHPADYELIRLCQFTDEGHVVGLDESAIVLSGAAVLAMQAKGPEAVSA